MTIWLPFRGEFGARMLWFVPTFHVAPSPKLICCEVHQECLYPTADEFYIVPSPADPNSTGATGAPGDEQLYEEIKAHFGDVEYVLPKHNDSLTQYFIVKPRLTYDLFPDVVLFKRMKSANIGKVWSHWDRLTDDLRSKGINVYVADNYNTDEIVWAIQHCKLALSVQTGGMYLCMLCGMRVSILCTEDEKEGEPSTQGIMVNDLHRMNISGCGWELVPHWNDYDKVFNHVLTGLEMGHAAVPDIHLNGAGTG